MNFIQFNGASDVPAHSEEVICGSDFQEVHFEKEYDSSIDNSPSTSGHK